MTGKICFWPSRWGVTAGISGDDGTVTTMPEGTTGSFEGGRDICKVCDAD